jgi:ribosomal protein S18 acetylase RimI-like enzyme
MTIEDLLCCDALDLARLSQDLFITERPWTAQDYSSMLKLSSCFGWKVVSHKMAASTLGQQKKGDEELFHRSHEAGANEAKVNKVGSSAEMLGFLLLQQVGSDIEILKLGIEREHQRQGLGTLLINGALTLHPFSSFFLEVDENSEALQFYQKLGFQVYSKRLFYYQKGTSFAHALCLKKIPAEF